MASSRRAILAGLGASLLWGGPKTGMRVLSSRPEDFEMPMDGFGSWITPVEKFFVRSHHYTPDVKLRDWKLSVVGKVSTPLVWTLDELKKLPRVELVSVLECAGNGRGLYQPSMPGLQWRYGAVGNARWAGVRLADVLRKAGLQPGAVEVLFDGADVAVGAQPEFQRSLPLKKALSPSTILAYEMNGEPLDPAHGFPLRLVVPGWAGDHWIKWVMKIEVRDTEFEGFFMKTAYRIPPRPVLPGSAVDPAQMVPVTSLSIKSVLASHADQSTVAPGPLQLTGAAWSHAAPVVAVEVSPDAGRTWKPATLGADRAPFAWRLWEFPWTPPGEAFYTILVRARNALGETQPLEPEWNPSGYSHNAVQAVRLHVTATPLSPAASPAPGQIVRPATLEQSCLTCHTLEPIEQQRLTRAQWEREVEKMQRWGAKVRPELKEVLVDFLANHYGVRPVR
jgi:sulfite oxidase